MKTRELALCKVAHCIERWAQWYVLSARRERLCSLREGVGFGNVDDQYILVGWLLWLRGGFRFVHFKVQQTKTRAATGRKSRFACNLEISHKVFSTCVALVAANFRQFAAAEHTHGYIGTLLLNSRTLFLARPTSPAARRDTRFHTPIRADTI